MSDDCVTYILKHTPDDVNPLDKLALIQYGKRFVTTVQFPGCLFVYFECVGFFCSPRKKIILNVLVMKLSKWKKSKDKSSVQEPCKRDNFIVMPLCDSSSKATT